MALKTTVRLGSRIFQQGALRQELTEVVSRTALEVEADVKLRIKQGAKSGRTYRRASIKRVVGEKKAREFKQMGLRRARGANAAQFVVGYRIHRASAAGESPADDTGHLANSIRATPARIEGQQVRADVTAGAFYARRLEDELNRPFFKPAVEKARPQFVADVNDAVRRLS